MVYLGTDTVLRQDTSPSERTVSVPGAAAAVIWGLGLLVGLAALAAGRELLAGVALVMAIMAPWFGLAWASRAQRRKAHAHRQNVTPVASYAGGWPAL